MAIEFDCPACDATIRVKDDAAGKKGRCPKCRVLLLVPDPGPEPEDEPSPPPVPRVELPPAPVDPVPQRAAPVPAPIQIPDARPEAVTATPAAVPSPVPPAVDEEPVEDDLVVVSTPNPTPLPIVADAPLSHAGRHTGRRKAGRKSSGGLWPAVIAVLAFLVLAGGAWLVYQTTLPDVPDVITGDRYRGIGLQKARFPAPSGKTVAEEVREPVLQSLASEGLPLKSGFVEVWLDAEGEELVVSVEPGPRTNAVRVPIGEITSIRSMLSRERDHIASIKSRELQRSTADFFRDFAAYLQDGTAMTRLPQYRDDVALNAATGVTGYAVEAIVGSTPFRCAYEDSTGGCYFFVPKETQKFRIHGRKLVDGKTPLPIEIDVIVKDAEGEPPTGEAEEVEQPATAEPGGEDDAKPAEDATIDEPATPDAESGSSDEEA